MFKSPISSIHYFTIQVLHVVLVIIFLEYLITKSPPMMLYFFVTSFHLVGNIFLIYGAVQVSYQAIYNIIKFLAIQYYETKMNKLIMTLYRFSKRRIPNVPWENKVHFLSDNKLRKWHIIFSFLLSIVINAVG